MRQVRLNRLGCAAQADPVWQGIFVGDQAGRIGAHAEGHFLPGEMGPKVLAAIRFIESGGKKVIISDVEKGWEAYKGNTGTHITE